MQIQITTITFPEITLQPRDAHKLRGYFGNLFKEHSALLHNHYETGELRYDYPLVQYKVIMGVPTLVALEEGSNLLTGLFLSIKKLELGGRVYEIMSKNIENKQIEVGYSSELIEYRFQTLWMALNQTNHKLFLVASNDQKTNMLNKILLGNVLSLLKGLNIRLKENERLMAKTNVCEKSTKFKDKDMIAFEGSFIINAMLPDGIGLGKAVSRGFGAIKKQ